MIFWCWRPPRSAGRSAVRPALTVMPTARFSPSAWSAIEAAARTAASIVDSSPRPAWIAALEVEEDPRVGGLLEVELLDLDLAVARGRLPVDPVHASPGAYGRTVVASGVVWSVRSGEAWLPSRRAAGRRQRGQRLEPRVDDDRRRPGRPSPTPRRSRTGRRSGCAAARSGSGRDATAARGRATTARSARRRVIARPGQRRPAASSGCGPRARASASGWRCAACR